MKILIKFYPLLIAASLIGIGSLSNYSNNNLTSRIAYAQSQEQVSEPLIVIAYLQVKPEHRQTFIELAKNVQTLTNKTEEGSDSYTFYEDKNTSNLFFFFEEWKKPKSF